MTFDRCDDSIDVSLGKIRQRKDVIDECDC